ncbi:IclR family transcriptional regulator [Pusillimonas minor]|uniref:Helix-turn-helix domain-containing protein n=1 Tax=Pusillimonas minor TaxID=2697024 RepID=A0A842HNS9_9BURK|nr:IclR family transcriptional regulator C-terminal domain-containing protein [Pusillimonas minor]MBC2769876.1 helix-turn-helix domain-containing protein [Pusillimonas minor]
MPSERQSSVDRLLSIPRLFTEEKPLWTVEEVAGALQISLSSAYRYFQSLLKFEYLDEVPGQGYCLGPAFIAFDRTIRITDPLAKVAGPVLAGLTRALDDGTDLIICQVYRKNVMCIHHENIGKASAGTSYERGRPMPFYRGATSKVILAHLPWRQQKREFESNSVAIAESGMGYDWKSFSAGLRDIRKKGYCVSHGEVDPGRVGIAAPIFSPDGQVRHSLSIVVFDTTTDSAREDRLTMSIVAAAALISERLALPN